MYGENAEMETGQRTAINLGAVIIFAVFVQLVFDNLALTIIAVLLFGGVVARPKKTSADPSED